MRQLGIVATVDLVLPVLVRAAYGGGGVLATTCGIVLGPLAVVAVHRLATRLAGPRFALGAATLVPALPLLGVIYALPPYRTVYQHDSLPALFGVAHPLWFALGVALALAAAFAPARAFAAAGLVAAVVGLAVWGATPLGDVRSALHEDAWSVAFAEWLPVAGLLGLALRSRWFALGAGGWLVFFVVRAAHRTFEHGHFWAALAPAVPSAALLAAAIALLVPRRRPAAH
jgi:hypothetical protein